jgi:cysteine desulfurase
MKLPIYLDNAATTPMDPRVAEKMAQFLTSAGHFGNPASLTHAYGHTAKEAVETARAQVAALIHAEPSEIIWTSGATEAINLALKGAAQLYQRKGRHIVTMQTEHKAVLDTCQELEKNGFRLTYLAPEENGVLDTDKFRAALTDETILAAVMHLNNETGVIQDIKTLAGITAEKNILFLSDAAQSNGKLSIDVRDMQVDFIALCAHKVYGPKGMGALYVRRKPRARVAAQIHGGGQEQGMRSGTLATHQIVGMGEAFTIAKQETESDYKNCLALRDLFLSKLSACAQFTLNGDLNNSWPGILNLSFDKLPSVVFMQEFPELAVSTGSACGSKGTEPSYVLTAMGLPFALTSTAIRFSFGRFTTIEECEYACACLQKLHDGDLRG